MLKARRSIAVTLAAGAIVAAAVASVASGGPNAAGYNTAQAAMVSFTTTPASGAPASSTADAIISVGDTIGGYTFESIPDGVSILERGNGRADVYVNHETSTVPFPYNPPFAGSEANQNDFTNSEVSLLTFTGHKIEINKASKAIASLENYQRFCSNYLATAIEGFKQPILFTNEEAQDWVFRSGTAWPGPTVDHAGHRGRRAGGRRRRARREERQDAAHLRDGAAQPREQRRGPRVRRARGALRRRHVPDEPAGVVAALHVHRGGREGDLGRRGHAPRLRRRRYR